MRGSLGAVSPAPMWRAGIVASIVMLAMPATAPAVTAEEAVNYLNHQRAAHGFPQVAFSPELTTGCRNHNAYMVHNGFGHGEDPSRPGYTSEGANIGRAEVLSRGGRGWSATENPWSNAPIHLYLMFNPRRTGSGYDESHGFACMRLDGEAQEPAAPAFYSHPGPFQLGVPFEQTAAEAPYIPQQLVGIPYGETTGPNILLFSHGFGSYLEAQEASLVGPDGPVDIRMVVESTRNDVGDGHWFRGGGVMIPVRPLASFRTYQGRVLWRNAASELAEQTFAFETAGRASDLSVDAYQQRGVLRIRVDTAAPNPTVAATGPDGRTLLPELQAGEARISNAAGRWHVCASAGGRDVGYQPETQCVDEDVIGVARVRLGRRARRGRVTVVAPQAAVGQRATVTRRSLRRRCYTVHPYGRSCVWRTTGRARKRTISLKGRQRIRIGRSRRGHKTRLTVSVPAFAVGDIRYRRVTTTRTYR